MNGRDGQATAPTRKAALVTGGSRGIGRAVAERLSADGFDVLVADRDDSDWPWSVRADVRSEADLGAAVDEAASRTGRLDVCVANAGIVETGLAVELDDDAFQRTIDVNLTGAWRTLRVAARQMQRQGGGGRLIATLSNASLRGEAGASAYCASKFGLRGVIECLALELAEDGILVNGVCPGEVLTDAHAALVDALARRGNSTPDTVRAAMSESVPLGRLSTAEEIAGVYAFLASDAAAYMTGTVVVADGGQVLAR